MTNCRRSTISIFSVALLLCLLATARAASTLSPDGSKALSSQKGGEIKLWDLSARKMHRLYRGHQDHVTSLAFSANGNSFLSGGQDGTIRLWNIADGNEVWVANREGDRRYPLFRQYGNNVECVAFMPDGENVFSAQRDGTVKLWNSKSGKEVRAGKSPGGIWSANLSPNGETALFTSHSRGHWTIHIWDVLAGNERKTFADTATASFAAFLSDGKRVLTGGHHSMRLWDSETGRLLTTLPNPTLIDSVALSPDGKTALVGAAYGGNGVITAWDIEKLKIVRRLVGHSNRVSELSFSADSAFALSGGHQQPLIKWNVPKGRILLRIKER